MVFCECLQGIEGVVHNKEVGPAVQVGVGRVGYHKISHAALQKFRDEPVSVILCGFEGEKEIIKANSMNKFNLNKEKLLEKINIEI